jgi:hypothetical protein
MNMRVHRFSMLHRVIRAAAMFALLALTQCGGGTSGTGLDDYQGEVRLLDGTPVAGARLTILETGDSATTDPSGNFTLNFTSEAPLLHILVETPEVTQTVTVETFGAGSTHGSLVLEVDLGAKDVHVTRFAVRLKFEPPCDDAFFEDGEFFQIRPLSDGTQCSITVRVMADGRLRNDIPVQLQKAPCDEEHWLDDADDVTGAGSELGIAHLYFHFMNDRYSCRYRVVAPFDYHSYHPVYISIHTLQDVR